MRFDATTLSRWHFFPQIAHFMGFRATFHKTPNSDFSLHPILWSTGGCYIKINFQIVGPLLCLLSYIGTLLYNTRGFSFRQTKSASNLKETAQAELQAKKCILGTEEGKNYTKQSSCNSVPTEKVLQYCLTKECTWSIFQIFVLKTRRQVYGEKK